MKEHINSRINRLSTRTRFEISFIQNIMPSELLLRNLKGLTTDSDLVFYDIQTLEISLLQISGSEFTNWILKTIVVVTFLLKLQNYHTLLSLTPSTQQYPKSPIESTIKYSTSRNNPNNFEFKPPKTNQGKAPTNSNPPIFKEEQVLITIYIYLGTGRENIGRSTA